MRIDKSRKFLITMLTLIFAITLSPSANALWGDSQSKLGKESYERLIKKNLELREEVNSLIKDHEDLRERYKILLEKVKALQQDKDALPKTRESSDFAEAENKRVVAELNKTLAADKDKISEMEGLIRKKDAAIRKDIESSYGKDLASLKESLKNSEERYKKALGEKDSLEKDLKEITAKLEKREGDAKILADEMKSQYAKTAAQDEKINELSRQLNTASQSQEAVIRDLEAVRKSLQDKDAEIKGQYKKIADYEAAMKDLNEIKKNYQAKENDINALNDLVKKLKSSIDDLSAEKMKSEAETARLQREISDLDAGGKATAREFETANAALDGLKASGAKKEEERVRLQKELDALDKSTKGQGENIMKLESSLGETNAKLKDKESALKDLSLTRTDLDTKINALEKSLSTEKNTVISYDVRLKEEGAKVVKLKNDLAASDSALREKEKKIDDISAARRTQDGHLKELEKNISDNKKIVGEQAKKLQIQGERIKDLEAEMDIVNASLKTTESELKAKKKEAKKLESVFDKASLKKKYPEMFEKNAAEKFKDSPAARRVRDAVARLDARRKAKEEEIASLDGELKKSAVAAKVLREKIKAADQDIEKSKHSIEEAKAAAKKESEDAAADEEKIKTLQDAFEKAALEQKDAQGALEGAFKKTADLQDALKKAVDLQGALKKTAANAPKSPAGPKSEEVISLEKDIVKAKADEDSLKEKARSAEDKSKKLEAAINEIQAKPKEDAAAKAVSGKEKIMAFVKDIEKANTEKVTLNKSFQHLKKNEELLKRRQDALLDDIKSDDKEILGLKKIIEREMMEITATQDAVAVPRAAGKGLVNKAENTLSELRDEIKALKAKNEELNRGLYTAKEAEKAALRKADSEERLPKALKQKIDKERLDMHYNLAVVYDSSGMYKDAEREYLKCLKINPNDAGVHYNLGILYDDKLNQNNRAKNHYNKYLALRPMGENVTQVRQWITDIELQERLGNDVR